MGLINEYIDRKLSSVELEAELIRLVAEYNKHRNSYLLIYSAAVDTPIPSVQLEQNDFYLIHDLLSGVKDHKKLDVYITTPGGSGETAEEIVRFLHKKFTEVSFVVAGEAKSAGTIMVLSGDEILMAETGSLGPIDAQVKIGRSVMSAHDYMEWVKKAQKNAQRQGRLNPFDATMVAQITPGELGGVYHALKFAEDLVVKWLIKYKFKNWNLTETRKKPVTEAIKKKQANKIARELTNHAKWRSHGRSIKIDDLEQIGLRITKIEDDPQLADIVYRIKTICTLLFETTSAFKIFVTQDGKVLRQAMPVATSKRIPIPQTPDAVQIEQKCPKCGTLYKLFAKLIAEPKIDEDMKAQGFSPFPKENKIVCSCGYDIDLAGIRNKIEIQSGRKLIID